ncbi:AraC family transcriptional regulator [Pleionea sp. CnH1-48]|uniref:AraC family transcriptional regulator n=1 Tax=Pleionea sp. CnH1-48 TaxID=2954494 RepID=UPI002096C951|nr:AraC family transcriptional regulator [Pleionea sp. CnH1-48]MCO7223116.1 AraC family transcriptional regulator [Pleionea sp. CnH1-48]
MNRSLWNFLSLVSWFAKEESVSIPQTLFSEIDKHRKLSVSHQYFSQKVIHQVLSFTGKTCLGLKMAHCIYPGAFYNLGYLFMTAPNLLVAIRKVSLLPRLYDNLCQFELIEDESGLTVRVSNDCEHDIDRYVVNEAALSIMVHYSQWVQKKPVSITDVQFAHSQINELSLYKKYLNVTPSFNQPYSQIRFPREAVEFPLLTSEPEYHEMLEQRLLRLHETMSLSFVDHVKVVMRKLLKSGEISRQILADELCISEKTLERRLSKNNESYRSLLLSIRKELAQRYLNSSHYSIEYIAKMLGYSDRNAFSKAYKKWMGHSPRAEPNV